MESKAYSITFAQGGRRGTAVVYAPDAEAAAEAFRGMSHPSKSLIGVEAVEDWSPGPSRIHLFQNINKGVDK